jgi:hypothetical protein
MNASKGFLVVSLALLLAVCASRVDGSELRVQVNAKGESRSVEGAVVCVGTTANPAQFGAQYSDLDGQARFAGIPHTPVVITVAKPRFRSHRNALSAQQSDRLVVVSLASGGGGPTCPQPRETGQWPGTYGELRVGDLEIEPRGARSVMLSAAVRGQPTQYRASERADFSDAEWQPYADNLRFSLSPGKQPKTIYFQVGRHRAIDGASLQSVSNVISNTVYFN